VPSRPISRRALGRTLLARQHLLTRTTDPLPTVVTHLVGLQAQVPRDPYLALWSRIERFAPADLEAGLLDHELARIVLMRGTIHLVTAEDALGLRPLVVPVLEQELTRHAQYAPLLRDVDLTPVLAHARTYLAEPRSTAALRAELASCFPDHDAAALAYACRNHLSLVQVPPRGLWQRSGQVTYATADAWLGGRPAIEEPVVSIEEPLVSIEEPLVSIEEMVVRYLRAFGPATPADLATWSRLTGFREVLDRLGRSLRTVTDEDGRVLFDVPDGHIADEEVHAPVRFLPEYDNVLLSHADRSRVIDRDLLAGLFTGRGGAGSVLVDGLLQASWRTDGDRVVITHQPRLPKRDRTAVEAEAQRALGVLAPGQPDATVELHPAENAGGPE
jgi:hypothetical protein